MRRIKGTTGQLILRTSRPIVLGLTALLVVGVMVPSPAYAAVTRYRSGSGSDVTRTAWNGPGFVFSGAGTIVPATMTKAIDAIRGGTGSLDVVVLADAAAASGSSTPECDAITALGGVNSCTTLILTSAADGNNSSVNTDIRNAEFVYFAGGNQCAYAAWKGTALQASVQSVVAKGGGVGGGSAGTHINSDVVYDACNGSVTSAQALADPYSSLISFTTGMFRWPSYSNTINDSHFVTRDRMGRTMAFVARAVKDGLVSGGAAWGVGIEQGGSVFLDRAGLATLTGADAYVVVGDHAPEQAVAGRPLTFSNFKIWRLTDGGTYDFAHRPTCGYYVKSVTNGVADSNLYSGTPVTTCGGNTVTVTNPGSQTGAVGVAVSLSVVASDSAPGQTLSYSATGLPAGLSINSGTGVISGTPTTAVTASVTVAASDPTGASGTATFSWTVGSSGGGSTYAEVEPNDSRSSANSISSLSYPLTVAGSMGSSTDRDYFQTSLGANQSMTVTCAIPNQYDADLYLMNSSGSTLVRSVNDGAGADESVTYTRTASGSATYYVDLEAFRGSGSPQYSCVITKG